jgi:hypothetical protein
MRMIGVVAALCALIACGRIGFDPVNGTSGQCERGTRTYPSGTTFPAGDGCNSCVCVEGVVGCTANVCADACASCTDGNTVDPCASMAGCPSVECTSEDICCGFGEQCIGGMTPTAVCACGTGGPCVLPQTCQQATTQGSVCGTVCQ